VPSTLKSMLDWFDSLLANRVFMMRLHALLAASLLVWTLLTYTISPISAEPIVSSTRLLIETLFVILCIHRLPVVWFERLKVLIITIASINSIIVILQLLETTQCISTNLNWLITDFWQLPVNEWTRKTGFFNGVLTSSLFSFFALALLARERNLKATLLMGLIAIPILFGARIFLLFLIPLLLIYWRSLLTVAALLLTLAALTPGCNFKAMLYNHYIHRIIPALSVVSKTDLSQDYSSKALASYYVFPETAKEWLFGNGYSRYAPQGGNDPAVMRWLRQSGLPALALVMAISGLICLQLLRTRNWGHALFAFALGLSVLKAELITATLLYSLLLLYSLSLTSRLDHRASETLSQPRAR